MKSVQRGFTLIELIVVIVILGILAATALPKFVDLSSDARRSVLLGIQGAASSAANMAYGKAAAAGSALSGSATVSINGSTVNLMNGYPTAAAINGLLQDSGGASFASGTWTLQSNCTMTYQEAASSAVGPTFLSAVSGC